MTKKNPPTLSSNEIRTQFLNYFHSKQHEIVKSSSLIPHNDPTLLFTNAGMVQFKEVFLGKEERSYKRATSSQRCVRAGGKHNDLERVGYTARHHTFFEMLGNFSFGDYFKREAIHFAWEFLTNILNLSPEKLWVTVFKEDTEAEAIWLNEIKVDPARFSRCGDEDNFWAMGPTGPCGPCTEIFYDHGPHIAGGPPGSETADGDRYVEIWNLVFMQYERSADGGLSPLPKPSVDTGMGLERITAVMQHVNSNYDTDLFQPIIRATAALAGVKNLKDFSLQVIADHIRSCSFLIIDGVIPANEGRGYVLRRIIRRAVRHGNKLGLVEPFFYRLVKSLAEVMGEAYPELIKKEAQVEKVLRQEEEQFSTTLSQGLKLFEQITQTLQGDIIPGETVFKLYDTYGFPADLTADMARERNLLIDYEGFEAAMSEQRERSRQKSQFTVNYSRPEKEEAPTEFTGHKKISPNDLPEEAKVLVIYKDGKFVNQLTAGEKGSIVLDRTPFYAESGGQVGDQGIIRKEKNVIFKVIDTIKQGQTFLHLGKLEKGVLNVGDTISAEIDAKRRAAIVLNHTATHLLHLALREVLGEMAIQKGSLVEAERLRFDFAHNAPISEEQLKTIELRVNEEIRANHEAIVRITTADEAIASGALALFGEKYGSKVRVVNFGTSRELCGGTHADHTGEIGLFLITGETGVAAGIRRLEAVTGEKALEYLSKRNDLHKQRVLQSEERIHQLEKESQELKDKLAILVSRELAKEAKKIGKVQVIATIVNELDGKSLRQTIDHLKEQLQPAVIVLATVKNNKVGIIGGVTENLTDKVNARELVSMVALQVGGRGGGKAEFAEAGGNNPDALEKALQSIYTWVADKVG